MNWVCHNARQRTVNAGLLDVMAHKLQRECGFTEAELDFIIHYEIKYRLGCDDGDDNE